MTQKDLAKATAAALNETYKTEGKAAIAIKTVDDVLGTSVKLASEALTKGEKIQINGFGTFEVTKRAAREGHNPATGEKIKIPAKNVVKFKAGKALKDAVN